MRKLVFIAFPINVLEIYEPLKKEKCELILGAEPAPPIVSERKRYNEDEIIGRCRDVHAILASPMLTLTARTLKLLEKLICICGRGIGFDNIDIKAASELGILVTNAPVKEDFISVAEHTVALILALTKKLRFISDLMAREGPSIYYDERVDTMILNEKTVGIIGLGRIGSRVARLLRPFNVRLLGYDPYIPEKKIRDMKVQPASLETLLKESDFITIHIPLTHETYHIIGAKELAMMKKTAYIINTARGAVIDEAALIDALKSGTIAGAALDVVEKEPISIDNPLLKMDNVLLTPHIAGRNSTSLIEGEKLAVENCLKILRGRVPKYVVNPAAIPVWRERWRKIMKAG
ncbi:MAG: NAD(P)-dependent oxidoreductase [Candidatus Bathyarchaeia archaeon]